MMILKFPEWFLWGSATSAYQVEGGVGNSDWSEDFPAGKACDHYNRYKEDFDIIQKLYQNAYRFSIEWSRVEAESGKWDEREIEHYRKVLRNLRQRNIKIMLTLQHFTNPLWFAKKGGWAGKEAASFFVRFAERVLAEYGDLVDFWITINEPEVYAMKSYLEGVWPPQKRNLFLFLRVIENQIMAHKKVYELFHRAKKDVQVGIAKNNIFFEPHNRKSIFDNGAVKTAGYFWNSYFLNRIKKHLDFIGLNYYFHNRIQFPFSIRNENKKVSDIGWEIYPEGIYHVLKDLQQYRLPIYITENGVADAKDLLRKNFIRDHLFWIHKAIQEGTDVRGYFHWSFMDNFEWEKGFTPRFGLAEVDYNTLERKIRPSAYYYAEICKTNILKLET